MTPQNQGASPFFRLFLGPPLSVSVGSRTFLGNLPSFLCPLTFLLIVLLCSLRAEPGRCRSGISEKTSEWVAEAVVSARSELGLPSGFSGLPAPGGWEDAGGKGMGSPEGNQLGPHNLNSLQVQPWVRWSLLWLEAGPGRNPKDRCGLVPLVYLKSPGKCNLPSLSLLGSPRRVTGLFSHKQRARWPGQHPEGRVVIPLQSWFPALDARV